jgi:hypothetical protein
MATTAALLTMRYILRLKKQQDYEAQLPWLPCTFSLRYALRQKKKYSIMLNTQHIKTRKLDGSYQIEKINAWFALIKEKLQKQAVFQPII